MKTLFSPPPSPALLPIPVAVVTAGEQAAMWEEVRRIANGGLRAHSYPINLRGR